VAKRSRFHEYRDRYQRWFHLEKDDDGILLLRIHTDGGEFVWTPESHERFADLWADVAGDREITVVIFTGTGDTFMDRFGVPDPERRLPAHRDLGAEALDETGWTGTQLHLNLLDVQVPIIAAVNGPCSMHAELPVMCDIVLASDDSSFEDAAHFPRGVVPGDGAHIVWPIVIGRNRARYFLLAGQQLSAQLALEYGAVNEVLPRAQLLERAWELARMLALRPPLTLRLTRSILVQEFRRAAADDLTAGVYQELYGMRNFLSWRGGQNPLDRPWNDEPWGGPA
jgi:enoyl-CoA hydratase/carnithine racemase